MELSAILKKPEYDFLQTDEHLGKHVILLGLAGSYSYGTNGLNSDIDIRGVMLNRKSDLVGLTQYAQYEDQHTDTTVYTFNKMVSLLLSCNPNTIELLGLNPEHYLYLNDIGKGLIEHTDLFLSKRAIQSFAGYADAQLRRLQNALARDAHSQSEKERHIYNSVKNAMYSIRERYHQFENGSLDIYVDDTTNPDMEQEISIDANLQQFPLRDYKSILVEMNNIVRDYDKIGKRNKKKDDDHLNKHAMHLVRLFMMGIDILEKGEINTYRKEEQKLLLNIRNGSYQNEDRTFSKEFYQIVEDYENKLNEAARHTQLPNEPNMERVQEYVMSVNEKVIRDEI